MSPTERQQCKSECLKPHRVSNLSQAPICWQGPRQQVIMEALGLINCKSQSRVMMCFIVASQDTFILLALKEASCMGRILQTLRVRYALDMIYTYSGNILIAVGPLSFTLPTRWFFLPLSILLLGSLHTFPSSSVPSSCFCFHALIPEHLAGWNWEDAVHQHTLLTGFANMILQIFPVQTYLHDM